MSSVNYHSSPNSTQVSPPNGKIHKPFSQDQGVLTKVQKSAFKVVLNQPIQIGNAKLSCKDFTAKLQTDLSKVPGAIIKDILVTGGVASQVLEAGLTNANFTFRPPNDWDFKVILQYADYGSFDLLAHAVLQIFHTSQFNQQAPIEDIDDFATHYRKPLVKVLQGEDRWALDSYRDRNRPGIDIVFIVKQMRPYDFPSFGIGISFFHSSESGDPLAYAFSGNYKNSLEELRSRTLCLIEPENLRHGLKNYIKHISHGFVAKQQDSESILITKFLQEMGHGFAKLQDTIQKYLKNHYETNLNGEICYLINFLWATGSICSVSEWRVVYKKLLPLVQLAHPTNPLLKTIQPLLCYSPELARLALHHLQLLALSSHLNTISLSYPLETKEMIHKESSSIRLKISSEDAPASYLIFKNDSVEELSSTISQMWNGQTLSLEQLEAFLELIQPEHFNKLKKKPSQELLDTLSGAALIKQQLPLEMESSQEDFQPLLLKILKNFQRFDNKATSSFQEELLGIFFTYLKTIAPLSTKHLNFALQLLTTTNSPSKEELFEQLLYLLSEGSKEAWDFYLQGKEKELIAPSDALPLFLYAFPSIPNEGELQLLQEQIKNNLQTSEKALEIYETHTKKILNTSKEHLQELYKKWIKPVPCSESMLDWLLILFKNDSPYSILFDQTSLYLPKKPLYLNEKFKKLFLEFSSSMDMASLNEVWNKAEVLKLTSQELKLAYVDYLIDTAQSISCFTAFELLLKPEPWTIENLKKKKICLNTILNFFKNNTHFTNIQEAPQKKLRSFASQQSSSLIQLLSVKKPSREQKEQLDALLKEILPCIDILRLSGQEGLLKAQELLKRLALSSIDFEPFKEPTLLILENVNNQDLASVQQLLKKCWGSSRSQELLFKFMKNACSNEAWLIPLCDFYLNLPTLVLTLDQQSQLDIFIQQILKSSPLHACRQLQEAYKSHQLDLSVFLTYTDKLAQHLISPNISSEVGKSILETIYLTTRDLLPDILISLIPSAEFETLQVVWNFVTAHQLQKKLELPLLFARLCQVSSKESLPLAEELFKNISAQPNKEIQTHLQFAELLSTYDVKKLFTLVSSETTLRFFKEETSNEELTVLSSKLIQLLLATPITTPNTLIPLAHNIYALVKNTGNTELTEQLFHLFLAMKTADSLIQAEKLLILPGKEWPILHKAAAYTKLISAYAEKSNSYAYLLWEAAELNSVFDYSQETSKQHALKALESLYAFFEKSSNFEHFDAMLEVLCSMRDYQLSDPQKLATYTLSFIRKWTQSKDPEIIKELFEDVIEQSEPTSLLESLISMLESSPDDLLKAYDLLLTTIPLLNYQCLNLGYIISTQLDLFSKRPEAALPAILKLIEQTKQTGHVDALVAIGELFFGFEKNFFPIREKVYTAFLEACFEMDVSGLSLCQVAEALMTWISDKVFKNPSNLIQRTLIKLKYGDESPDAFICARDLFLIAKNKIPFQSYGVICALLIKVCVEHSKIELENKKKLLIDFATQLIQKEPLLTEETTTLLFCIPERIGANKNPLLYPTAHEVFSLIESKTAHLKNLSTSIKTLKNALNKLK